MCESASALHVLWARVCALAGVGARRARVWGAHVSVCARPCACACVRAYACAYTSALV